MVEDEERVPLGLDVTEPNVARVPGTGRRRSDEEILAWSGDWEVLEPGLVPLPEWRPGEPPSVARRSAYYGFAGAVARKR